MTARPRLSLVVPVYNVAAYLPRCLESLAALTPPADEIVVVDDGSTDECPAILAAWADKLPQMRVIRQENGGLSAARNTGLAHAKGKWLAFVDSDDFVDPEAYGRLMEMAEADDLDMALMNAEYHYEGRRPDAPIYPEVPASPVISGAQWLKERLAQGRLLHMVWMHLYRRSFIEEHGLRFVPRLIHEDVIWTTRALLLAQRVRYDPRPGYHYRIPLRRFTPEQNARRLCAIIDSSMVNARTLAEISERGVADPELKGLLRKHLVDGGFSVFHKARRLPMPLRRHCYHRLRSDGYFGLLWRHAAGLRQRRRIARNYLISFLP